MKLKLFGDTTASNTGESKCGRAYVHSHEGDIYLLEVEQMGVSQFVENNADGKLKTFKSFAEAKQYANKKMSIERVELAFNTPYDQMIGLASQS